MAPVSLPPTLDQSVGFNLDRVAVLLRRELLRVLAGEGLVPEQWQVLVVLDEHGPLSQQVLADVLLADKHTMSRTLARMERDGWILRTPSPDDARAQRVSPTRKAASRVTPLKTAIRTHVRHKLAPMAGPRLEQLLALLKQLRSVLQETP